MMMPWRLASSLATAASRVGGLLRGEVVEFVHHGADLSRVRGDGEEGVLPRGRALVERAAVELPEHGVQGALVAGPPRRPFARLAA